MLTFYDEFCGAGGSSQGCAAVPYVQPVFAANHWDLAIQTHAANFPTVDHYQGDIAKARIEKFPAADLFWASPACPPWSNARGKRRDFDRSTQPALFGDTEPDANTKRARALMEEIPRYLNAMALRGRPVLAGVVENVTECYFWDQFDRWRDEIAATGPGYHTRLIAANSAHFAAPKNRRAPQSRDRLYLAYISKAIGRVPDWDKWLRPAAWCPSCDKVVRAIQVFKKHGMEMGRYRSQYEFRCPSADCRGRVVEPHVLGAETVIDFTLPSQRIGDRKTPLAFKTMGRVGKGFLKFSHPYVAPAGGTWRNDPTSVTEPLPTRLTRESDGVACPPLLVPVEGRDGKEAQTVTQPGRTQTARAETAVAIPPVIVTLRGGGSHEAQQPLDRPLTTVSASGNHHGLMNQPVDMLVPYYSNGTATRLTEPMGALSTVDRYGRAHAAALSVDTEAIRREVAEIDRISAAIAKLPKRAEGEPKSEEQLRLEALGDGAAARMADAGIDHVEFRMLATVEIKGGMAFQPDYIILGKAKRDVVRQLGNAVTPNVPECIMSALVEAITGESFEPADPFARRGLDDFDAWMTAT